jgi:hypothetical protein
MAKNVTVSESPGTLQGDIADSQGARLQTPAHVISTATTYDVLMFL